MSRKKNRKPQHFADQATRTQPLRHNRPPAPLGVRAAHRTLRPRRTTRAHPPRTAGVRRAAVRWRVHVVMGGLDTLVCAWLIAPGPAPRYQRNRYSRACNPTARPVRGHAARR